MATEKAPTKADFLAALNKKGIKSLEDLIDAVMPEPDETGGYIIGVMGMAEEGTDGVYQILLGHLPLTFQIQL